MIFLKKNLGPGPAPGPGPGPRPRNKYFGIKIMEFGLKWIHMARYGLILKLDGALWLRIISKPLLLTPQTAMEGPKI